MWGRDVGEMGYDVIVVGERVVDGIKDGFGKVVRLPQLYFGYGSL